MSDKTSQCHTCGNKLSLCTGHFGYIKLEFPVFHIGFFKALYDVLQCICKNCGRVLLSEMDRERFLKQVLNKTVDSVSSF